jgi:hypothetical protein
VREGRERERERETEKFYEELLHRKGAGRRRRIA